MDVLIPRNLHMEPTKDEDLRSSNLSMHLYHIWCILTLSYRIHEQEYLYLHLVGHPKPSKSTNFHKWIG